MVWALKAAATYGIATAMCAVYLALIGKGMLEAARHPHEECNQEGRDTC